MVTQSVNDNEVKKESALDWNCILRRPAATDAFASGRAAVANGHLIKCFPLP